eukprot:2762026-Rhodomonas_salina.5
MLNFAVEGDTVAGSTIRYLSTGHRIASYAFSVRASRRLIAAYAIAVPDFAQIGSRIGCLRPGIA